MFDNKCGVCRIDMSFINVSRNRIAELLVKNTLVNCSVKGCKEQIYYGDELKHLNDDCQFVITTCKYKLFGCDWKGIRGIKSQHEDICKTKIDLDNVHEKFSKTIDEIKKTNKSLQIMGQRKVFFEKKKHKLELMMIHNFCNYFFVFELGINYTKQNNTGDMFQHSFKMSTSQFNVDSNLILKFVTSNDKIDLECKTVIACTNDIIDDIIEIGIIFEWDHLTASNIISLQKPENEHDNFDICGVNEWNVLFSWHKDEFEYLVKEGDGADVCRFKIYISN